MTNEELQIIWSHGRENAMNRRFSPSSCHARPPIRVMTTRLGPAAKPHGPESAPPARDSASGQGAKSRSRAPAKNASPAPKTRPLRSRNWPKPISRREISRQGKGPVLSRRRSRTSDAYS